MSLLGEGNRVDFMGGLGVEGTGTGGSGAEEKGK